MTRKRKAPRGNLKSLTLKIRYDTWIRWKIQAAREGTTMSELAEKLVDHYCDIKKTPR